MPPVILWAIGAVSALAAVKLFRRATQKANAELDEIRRGDIAPKPVEKLERDPASGVYRPRRN
jgi:hypothetical protein